MFSISAVHKLDYRWCVVGVDICRVTAMQSHKVSNNNNTRAGQWPSTNNELNVKDQKYKYLLYVCFIVFSCFCFFSWQCSSFVLSSLSFQDHWVIKVLFVCSFFMAGLLTNFNSKTPHLPSFINNQTAAILYTKVTLFLSQTFLIT